MSRFAQAKAPEAAPEIVSPPQPVVTEPVAKVEATPTPDKKVQPSATKIGGGAKPTAAPGKLQALAKPTAAAPGGLASAIGGKVKSEIEEKKEKLQKLN